MIDWWMMDGCWMDGWINDGWWVDGWWRNVSWMDDDEWIMDGWMMNGWWWIYGWWMINKWMMLSSTYPRNMSVANSISVHSICDGGKDVDDWVNIRKGEWVDGWMNVCLNWWARLNQFSLKLTTPRSYLLATVWYLKDTSKQYSKPHPFFTTPSP